MQVVRYGTRVAWRGDVFLNFGLYGEPNPPIRMGYFFWVLRNQARGQPRPITTDDLVSVPPGEAHRYGARPHSVMTHLTISIGLASWAEEVSEKVTASGVQNMAGHSNIKEHDE